MWDFVADYTMTNRQPAKSPRAEELEGDSRVAPRRVQEQKILEEGRKGSDLVPRPELGNNLVSKKEYQLPSTMRYRQKIVALEFYILELITAMA